ncbi:MAG TPA: flavodoxin domain-containing protein [Vicinamibacteria bacterium]|nr:flavodoxin domain-containing protein [Vicinamibacteria bacterium]
MSAKGLGRRRFVKAGGAAAGGLVVGGAGLWAATPHVDYPEVSYPGNEVAQGRVLVAYASKAASTAEVAAVVARKLADTGLAVDLRRARNVRSVDAYRAVVVGSAIRAGHWLGEASGFVKTHREALVARKTAFFTLCMTLQQDTPANREKVAAYLKPMRQVLEPDWIEFFAGKMEYRRLALGPRLIVKAMKVPEGDFRDWNAIGSWADRLATGMVPAAA